MYQKAGSNPTQEAGNDSHCQRRNSHRNRNNRSDQNVQQPVRRELPKLKLKIATYVNQFRPKNLQHIIIFCPACSWNADLKKSSCWKPYQILSICPNPDKPAQCPLILWNSDCASCSVNCSSVREHSDFLPILHFRCSRPYQKRRLPPGQLRADNSPHQRCPTVRRCVPWQPVHSSEIPCLPPASSTRESSSTRSKTGLVYLSLVFLRWSSP